MEGDDTLATKRFVLSKAGQTQSVSIDINPKTPGPQYFRVFVEPHIGEGNRSNNEILAFANILAARIRVLVVAGRAQSRAVASFPEALQRIPSIAATAMVYKNHETAYEDRWQELSGADVVILLSVGPRTVSAQHLKAIAEKDRKRFRSPDSRGQESISKLDGQRGSGEGSPCATGKRRICSKGSPPSRRRGRQNHSVFSPLAHDVWTQLAPLSGYVPTAQEDQPGISSSTLRSIMIPHSSWLGPMVRESHRRVVHFVLASGPGNQRCGGRPQSIRQFWQSAVRWLGQGETSGRLQAAPERQVYRAGEPLALPRRYSMSFSALRAALR